MDNRICLVIIGKNSSGYLIKYKGLLNGFKEVIFIDDYSTDNTEDICKENGFRYYKRHLHNDFASQRNFALNLTESNWVLYIDTDEVIDSKFIKEIKGLTKSNDNNGYYIKRNDAFIKHIMTGTEMGNDRVIRLAKKNCGVWKRKVHEYWDIKGNIGIIDAPVLHNTANNLNSFIYKLLNYSIIHYKENISSGKKSGLFILIAFPKFKFINNFIFLKGFKDGSYGFVVSILMSFHSFLSWSNSWLSSRSK